MHTFSQKVIFGFMKLFFYLLYNPFAWSYDLVSSVVSFGKWNRWILNVIPYIQGSKVLELGHGPGHLQIALHEKDYFHIGVDKSAQMGKLARRRLVKNGLIQPALTRADGRCLPFRSASFDSIVATFPTEYIIQPETLQSIHRVLVPGGRLVVLPAAWITGRSLPERVMALIYRITGQVPPPTLNIEEMLAPVKQHGFAPRLKWIENAGSRLMVIVADRVQID